MSALVNGYESICGRTRGEEAAIVLSNTTCLGSELDLEALLLEHALKLLAHLAVLQKSQESNVTTTVLFLTTHVHIRVMQLDRHANNCNVPVWEECDP